jgi:hypothetical protein
MNRIVGVTVIGLTCGLFGAATASLLSGSPPLANATPTTGPTPQMTTPPAALAPQTTVPTPTPTPIEYANMMARLCVAGGTAMVIEGGAAGEVGVALRTLDAQGRIQGNFNVSKATAEGLVKGIDGALTQYAAAQADSVRECLKPVREFITLRFLAQTISTIRVIGASYGGAGGPTGGVDMRHNVRGWVAEQCNGQSSCAFQVGNHMSGRDPAPGVHKDLRLEWKCVGEAAGPKGGGDAVPEGGRAQIDCR